MNTAHVFNGSFAALWSAPGAEGGEAAAIAEFAQKEAEALAKKEEAERIKNSKKNAL